MIGWMFDRETKREKSLEQIKKQGGQAKKARGKQQSKGIASFLMCLPACQGAGIAKGTHRLTKPFLPVRLRMLTSPGVSMAWQFEFLDF